MKILVVTHFHSIIKYGGGEVFNRNLIKTLLKQGHEVFEYTIFNKSNLEKYENFYNSENYHVIFSNYFKNKTDEKQRKTWLNILKINRELEKFINENNFDLIFNNGAPENYINCKKRNNWIQIIHDHPEALLGFNNYFSYFFKIKSLISNFMNWGGFLNKTNGIIFSDQEIQNYLFKLNKKYKKIKNQFIIPFPVHEFNDCKYYKNKINEVVWIGRISNNKKKNIVFLNEIANELEKYKIKLNVYGKGPLLNKLSSKNIVYHGWLEDSNEKNKILSRYKCFVMPSKFEGFSLVLVEAMKAGLPIIALDTFPSIRFYNKSEGVFLLDKKTSPNLFASEINKLLNKNNDEYEKLVKSNIDFYNNYLSLDIFEKNIKNLISYMKNNN